jgi:hypothetical protein
MPGDSRLSGSFRWHFARRRNPGGSPKGDFMLFVAQFPIADARPFLPRASSRLDLPDWPTPQTEINPQFVRFFGPAVRRRRGADAAWIDERAFCRADRAIRFVDLPSQLLGLTPSSRSPSCVFRRLLYDGSAVARVEVGLTLQGGGAYGIRAGELFALVASFLDVPTTVTQVSGDRLHRPLMLQGSHLAELYARATVRWSGDPSPDTGLVEDGVPLVVIGLDDQELPELPESVRLIDPANVHGASLGFTWLRTQHGTIGAWLLAYGSASREQLRSLRVCLLRLHAERQVLDLVLKQIRRGRLRFDPEDDSGEALQEYLNQATRLIQREQFFGVSQSALLAAFDAAEGVIPAADQAELLLQLDRARNQVRRKVEAYARDRAQIRTIKTVTVMQGGNYMEGSGQFITGGSFIGNVINKIAAQTIEDSFNTIANSGVSGELKASLTALHDEVARLTSELENRGASQETIEDTARLLATFVEQATEKRPLQDVLVGAGKGLVDAAKAVSERVAPIAGAVGAVLKLLGVGALL